MSTPAAPTITDPKLQQAISAAWQDQSAWVAGLGTQVPGTALDDMTLASTIGVCGQLDPKVAGGPWDPYWEEDDGGSTTLSAVKLTTLTGPQVAAPTFPTDGSASVVLGVSFQTLAVQASYSYSQPCSEHSPVQAKAGEGAAAPALVGHADSDQTLNGTGSITQTISPGVLAYYASCDAGALTLTLMHADATGQISTNVSPDGDDGGWLGALDAFLGDGDTQEVVARGVGNVFTNASFSSEMITLLNKQLQQ